MVLHAEYDAMAAARAVFRQLTADLADARSGVEEISTTAVLGTGEFARVFEASGSHVFAVTWDAVLVALNDACGLVAGNIDRTTIDFQAVDRAQGVTI